MDESAVLIGRIEQASHEIVPYAIDFSARMAPGDSLSAPTAQLLRALDNSDYSSTGILSTAIDQNQVQVALKSLEPGTRYWLLVGATISSGNKPGVVLEVFCPR